jgi:VanZ family protein
MIAAMNRIRRWFDARWLVPATASLLVLLVLTHIPQELMPRSLQVHLIDKIEHMVAYGAVALLFLLSFRRPPGVTTMFALLLIGAVIGGADEVTQPWFNRMASVHDWVADVVGMSVACGVFSLIQLLQGRRASYRRSQATDS